MTNPVLVVGGGPAGATVATLLAQRGFQVCLFERERFPRAHIGESLLPATLAVLEQSGALPAVEAEAFTSKAGATMVWGTDTSPWSWFFRETNTRYPTSFQVERPRFDQILLDHATACGVEVQQEISVSEILIEDDRCGVVLADGFIPGSFVVDASGQRTLLGNQLRTKQWDRDFRNLSAYSYFQGGDHLSGEESGNILVESVNDGWFWKIPLRDQVSSVGIVVDRENALPDIRSHGLQNWYEQQVHSSRLTGRFLRDATQIESCNLVRDWSYTHTRFAGENYCLVGDAACFIDPLFSTGVHLAVSGAHIAAAFVETQLEDNLPSEELARSYDALYRQQYDHFRELTKLFYSGNRSVDSYFWQSRRLTGQLDYEPRAAFLRSVSGQNAAGYERSVLQHAELPSSLVNQISDLEQKRDRRKEALQLNRGETVSLAMTKELTLEKRIVLGERRFEMGHVVAGTDRVAMPISGFVNKLLREFDEPSTATAATRRLAHNLNREPNELLPMALAAIELLTADGVLEIQSP